MAIAKPCCQQASLAWSKNMRVVSSIPVQQPNYSLFSINFGLSKSCSMFGKRSQDYTVLSGSTSPTDEASITNGVEEEHEACIEKSSAQYQRRQARRHWWHLLLLYIVILLLLSWNVGGIVGETITTHPSGFGVRQDISAHLIATNAAPAPVQNVVQYQKVEFGKYFKDRSPYMRNPSKELDAMWEDLYKCKWSNSSCGKGFF